MDQKRGFLPKQVVRDTQVEMFLKHSLGNQEQLTEFQERCGQHQQQCFRAELCNKTSKVVVGDLGEYSLLHWWGRKLDCSSG